MLEAPVESSPPITSHLFIYITTIFFVIKNRTRDPITQLPS